MLTDIRHNIAMAVSESRLSSRPTREAAIRFAEALYSIVEKIEELQDERRTEEDPEKQ